MGVVGYISAIITSDTCSVIFLAITSKNLRYLQPLRIDRAVPGAMLRYSIPMVPNTIFWWITNIANRFLIAALMSQTDAGLYVAAYKVPNLIVLVSGIFMDAWQMSAVTETKGRNRFFTRVFTAYYALIVYGCFRRHPVQQGDYAYSCGRRLLMFPGNTSRCSSLPPYSPAW